MEKKWWTLLAVCAGTFMLLLDVTIVLVALPEIQTSFHSSFSDIEWVIDAYALTLASLLLTTGVLADRYGRRLLFGIGLTVFTLGSLACGLAQSTTMLIVSRSAQGIGGATMYATSLALLGQSFRGKDRGVAFGIWGAITGVAVSLGPILGGVITSDISWRAIFLVNVPIGIGALAVTAWRIEESRVPHPGRPDWVGFGLLTTGLISLVYGLIRASDTGWGNSRVVTCLTLGGVLLAVFVIVEMRVRRPMFDLSLFRTPAFTGGLFAAFTMNGSLFAIVLYLVLYLQDLLGYSAIGTGLRLLVMTGGMFVAAAFSGRLSERVPVRWLIAPGLALVGTGLLLMSGLSGTSTWTHLLPGLIVTGLGAGLVNPPLASTAIGVVTPERSGMASGVNGTFRQIGLAVSIATLGSIFASSLQHHIDRSLSSISSLARQAPALAKLVQAGDIRPAIAAAPPAHRVQLASVVRSSFASGINELVVIAGIVALIGAAGSLILIRGKDFLARDDGSETGVDSRSGHSEQGPAIPARPSEIASRLAQL